MVTTVLTYPDNSARFSVDNDCTGMFCLRMVSSCARSSCSSKSSSDDDGDDDGTDVGVVVVLKFPCLVFLTLLLLSKPDDLDNRNTRRPNRRTEGRVVVRVG